MPKVSHKTYNKVKTRDLPGDGLIYGKLCRAWSDQENYSLFVQRSNLIKEMFKTMGKFI